MTFDFVDVLVIVTCVAVLCRELYWFVAVVPKIKEFGHVLKKFAADGQKLFVEGGKIFGEAKKEMDSLSARARLSDLAALAKRTGGHRMEESEARALLKEDVELMKQWTHDAFIATLNRQPPPEVPEKIIQRYGKAGDADHIFS